MTPPGRYDAVVVGAGISGLYLLHRLRRLGLSVLVVDAGDGHRRHLVLEPLPGRALRHREHDYSYSFVARAASRSGRWTERYADQPEILAYLEHVADRFDLRRDIRLGTRVAEAAFDEPASAGRSCTDGGDAALRRAS